MNNSDVQLLLTNCDSELAHIETIITGLGGTIEIAFKPLIADFCSKRSKPQVKNFLNKRVRENSANPSYQRILQILAEFDGNWVTTFKTQMQSLANYNSITSSVQSLVDARNDFAHGGNPTITFADIKNYFDEAKQLILTLDNVIG